MHWFGSWNKPMKTLIYLTSTFFQDYSFLVLKIVWSRKPSKPRIFPIETFTCYDFNFKQNWMAREKPSNTYFSKLNE